MMQHFPLNRPQPTIRIVRTANKREVKLKFENMSDEHIARGITLLVSGIRTALSMFGVRTIDETNKQTTTFQTINE